MDKERLRRYKYVAPLHAELKAFIDDFFPKYKRKETVFFWSRGIFTKIRLSKTSDCTVHVLNAHLNNTSRVNVDCRGMGQTGRMTWARTATLQRFHKSF